MCITTYKSKENKKRKKKIRLKFNENYLKKINLKFIQKLEHFSVLENCNQESHETPMNTEICTEI